MNYAEANKAMQAAGFGPNWFNDQHILYRHQEGALSWCEFRLNNEAVELQASPFPKWIKLDKKTIERLTTPSRESFKG